MIQHQTLEQDPALDVALREVTVRAPGITRHWNESWYPVRDEHSEIIGFSGVVVEITERKQAQVDLIEATAVAEKANQAKSDFLSTMSHELRTPLHAILGFAQLIESGTPAPTSTQGRHLEQIIKGGWYLLRLIEQLLDLAQIELVLDVASRSLMLLNTKQERG